MKKLISISEAAAFGIQRLRLPKWVEKMDHIKLDIVDGGVGPWLHFFSPYNKEINDRDPVDLLWAIEPMKTDINSPEWEIYDGPLPESDEYKVKVMQFNLHE